MRTRTQPLFFGYKPSEIKITFQNHISKSRFKITFQNYISKSHLRHRIYERIQHLLVGRMKRALNRQHILENRCSLER